MSGEWTMKTCDVTHGPGGEVFPLAFMPKRRRFEAVSYAAGGRSKEFPTRRAALDWLTAMVAKRSPYS